MLEFFRKHSKWVLFIIIILIVPSFVFFGTSKYSGMSISEKPLVKVNKEKITERQFNKSWTERLNSLRDQLGNNFKVSEIDTPANRNLWLNKIVDDILITQTANKNKFFGSDSMVRSVIALDPKFAVDGKFSMENYNAFLTSANITSQEYENYLRANTGINLVVEPLINSTLVPPTTLEELKKHVTKTREVQTKIFANEDFINAVSVDEKELEDWYKKNSEEKYRVPEYVNVEYFLLNQKAAVDLVPQPNEDALKSYYENNKNRFSTEERRFVRHIQLDSEERAKAIYEELKTTPNKFEEFVLSDSLDAGTKNNKGELGFLKKSDIPGIENTVFALDKPGITGPVKLGNSFHIFDVVQIEKAKVKSFEELKDTLVNEVKLQIASDKFAELSTNLTNLVHDRSDDLKTIAEDLQLQVSQVFGLSKSGLISDVPNQMVLSDELKKIFNSPRVIDTAYSSEVYNQGQNSGVIEISPSEFLVFKILDKVESKVPELKAVKAKVTRDYQLEKGAELAKKAGDEFINIYKNNPSEAPKASDGSSLLRDPIETSIFASNLPENLMRDVMAIPNDKLPTYVAGEVPDGYAVVRVIKDAIPDERMVRVFEQQFPIIVKNGVSAQVGDSYKASLRKTNKVIFTDVAQKTIEAPTK
ncbi:SurA N-terminal domain-containing protein [Taylorella equigenitalis]|uniref:SurA N-terminal domain-containing protein n=1 Tax=Taylorella equigenitalis TaxID=29575 RepID=UPI00237C857A|nr:SurA N-terminal domain-containing protein [Taylorella equigenitalis]WDU46978.1 SurA N-terminal domain-containing protein [Taylorella equigenitalis]